MRIKGNGIPDIIQFKRLLRDRGLKATPQRSAVHEAMWNLVHASADDVAAWLAEHGSVHVSSASVYNILTLLADLGIYGRRSARGGKMVFDARVAPASLRHAERGLARSGGRGADALGGRAPEGAPLPGLPDRRIRGAAAVPPDPPGAAGESVKIVYLQFVWK